MQAILVHEHGAPEVLTSGALVKSPLKSGEVRVRVAYAGINFIDVINPSGHDRTVYESTDYPQEDFPFVPGMEGAGVVSENNSDRYDLNVGTRVAFWNASGSYRESLRLSPEQLVPVPQGLSLKMASASLLQGLTTDYLTRDLVYESPKTALVHAASGGVGELLVQELVTRNCEVYGTCSNEKKSDHIRSLGAEPIRYDDHDFSAKILSKTDGGVDLAYDNVGRDTFRDTIKSTRTRGHIIFYGQSSGSPDPIRPRELLGSRTLSTSFLEDFVSDEATLRDRAERIFSNLIHGRWNRTIDRTFPLSDADEAHRYLERRSSVGKLLLSVDPSLDDSKPSSDGVLSSFWNQVTNFFSNSPSDNHE